MATVRTFFPSRADRQLDAMITRTAPDATELVGLAERIGVPTEDAVCLVLKHLTDQQLSVDVVEARRSVRRMSPCWTVPSTSTMSAPR